MIKQEELIKLGQTFKPHGINGEITVVSDFILDELDFSCFVFELDGIYVPFFASKIRPKKSNSFLVKFDSLNSETEVEELSNRILYVLKSEFDNFVDVVDDGMYAEDFIGYNIITKNSVIGNIIDIDDSTENALFIVERQDDSICYIPIVDDFITDIDTDNKVLGMQLPDGLLDL